MSDLVQEDPGFEEKRAQYDYEMEVYKRNFTIYEEGRKNWEIIENIKTDQEKHFDKTAMTIAAGSFGVSFAFIDTIVPLEKAIYKPVLLAAWVLFGICMCVILLGYRISSVVYRSLSEEEKQNVKKSYENKPIEYKRRRVYFNGSEICNYLALIMNWGGIICLILFVFLNF